jgi:hypothetical protein
VSADRAGTSVDAYEQETAGRVMVLTRLGQASVPARATLLQEGDLLHVLADTREPSGVTS